MTAPVTWGYPTGMKTLLCFAAFLGSVASAQAACVQMETPFKEYCVTEDLALIRRNADRVAEPGFGGVPAKLPVGASLPLDFHFADSYTQPKYLVQLDDGSYILIGFINFLRTDSWMNRKKTFALRFDAAGIPHRENSRRIFGNAFTLRRNQWASSVLKDAHNQIWILFSPMFGCYPGHCETWTEKSSVVRLDSDGSIDRSFGRRGALNYDAPETHGKLSLTADGRIRWDRQDYNGRTLKTVYLDRTGLLQ